MSWEKRPNGRYLVRWRDSAGRARSKTVYRQRDAIALDSEMKRKRSMGELVAHERGDIDLRDFYELWWANYALPNTTARTRDVYARLWRIHIDANLGVRKLRTITPEQISALVGTLGKTLAPGSVIRVLALLRNVLQRAVEWQYIGDNPATHVKRPKANHRRGRALTAIEISRLCADLDARSHTIVCTLAWTGLRPGELRALRWGDLRDGSLLIQHAVSSDAIGPTKTGKSRNVSLRPDARKLLLAWYMIQGQPSVAALVFPAVRGGCIWTDTAYNIWTTRVFVPAASRAGLKGVRPYDLRHTFVSTLISEGHNVEWIARQAGHSLGVLCDTYAHLLGDESVSSEWHANRSVLENLRASSDS